MMRQYPTSEDEILDGESASKLRLCFVADPGSIHTVRWIRFFAERGHCVALASFQSPGSDLRINIHCPLSPRGPLRGTRILRNIFELRRFVHSFKPHVLHAHYINEAGWIGALSGFRPFVVTAWGSDVYVAPRVSAATRVLTEFAVRRADYVTADSYDQIEILRQMGASRHATEVVGWGVDFSEFSGSSGKNWRAKHSIEDNQIVILSPRQWVANSNIPMILDAFARVHRQRGDTVLILKSRSNVAAHLREQVEAQSRRLGITGATLIVGDIPEMELPELYAASDITVSVCSSDGTPVSVLEAMASYSAVIAGDLPSLREWIREGETGVLVPVNDSLALAVQLVRLAEDLALRRRLAEAAYQLVKKRADRRVYLERMERTYLGLAGTKAS